VNPMDENELLRARILIALADDEEYPEEIYTDVNFLIEERIEADGGRLYYRACRRTFRLTEILEALDELLQSGFVTFRAVDGYAECCGMTSRLYRVTERGDAYLHERVLPVRDRLYD
jgi:hypothetical protein